MRTKTDLHDTVQLTEASGTLTLFRKYTDNPRYKSYRGVIALPALIKYLHTDTRLSHEMANYKEVDAFDWRKIKSDRKYSYSDKDTWLVIIGEIGSACIMYQPGTDMWYTIVSSADNRFAITTMSFGRINDAMNNIKPRVGKVIARYIGTGEKARVRPKNQELYKRGLNNKEIQDRISPMLDRAIEQAIADVRGMVITQLKNDAFEKALPKVQKLNKLTLLLDTKDATARFRLLENYIHLAVINTASHFYPELTGDIYKSYDKYHSRHPEGPAQVRKDIQKGDMKKLAYVLYSLKRELVALL